MLLGLFFAGQLHSDFRAVIISPVAGQDPADHADDLTDELFFAGQLHSDFRDIIISPVAGQDPANHAGDLAGGAVLDLSLIHI